VSNNFKKIDFIKNLSNKTGFSSKFSSKLIEDLLQIINLNITKGKLNIKNIGTFKLLKKKERIGRNPKTKKEYIISSRKSISFIPSKKLSKNLNKFYE